MMKSTTSITSILALLMILPCVLNKALPQEENEINPDPTTIVPDSDSDGSLSTSKRPPPRRINTEFPRVVIDDVQNDYDMFLDHVNKTAQYKLELFDKTLEQELQPGRPLMLFVELVLNLFQQVQTNNSRRKPNNNNNNNNKRSN